MPGLQFISQRIQFSLPHKSRHASWLKQCARKHRHRIEDLTYVFCSDNYLLKLNSTFLGHQTLTDIITFDLSEEKAGINAEVYISIPRVRDNAKIFKTGFDPELRRVMAHGLLHLVGFNDKGPAAKAQMRREEEACLSLWK